MSDHRRRRRTSEMESLGAIVPRGVPGMSRRLWRRLALAGAWRSVAGEALARACVPVDVDEKGGLVLLAAEESWAREIALNEESLRRALHRATGEPVSRLTVRVDPTMVPRGCRPEPGRVGRPYREGNVDRTCVGDANQDMASASAPLLDRLERLRDLYLAAAAKRRGSGSPPERPPTLERSPASTTRPR